ncbi:MAG: PhzF family phenazine biosynthesis protein [Deltaproteobacteria bacterium]|jgi:PhzF family phenazine biosynthesis protein|nr:PhzF family phenazine biosynthesis protein [Deltaproteobacteria bacterium]
MLQLVRKVLLVDALGYGQFSGAPTVVIFLEAPLDKFKMASLSRELGSSQTVFVLAHNKTFLLRFFNQLLEIPLGGHSCHAAAHLIYELGLLPPSKPLTFLTQEGELAVKLTEPDSISVTFPAINLTKMDSANLELYGSILAIDPKNIAWGAMTASRQAIIAVDATVMLKKLSPDRARLAKSGASTLAVTSAADTVGGEYSLRCFGPNENRPEQQVSVNIHRSLAPHWSRLLGTKKLQARQLSGRGSLVQLDVSTPNQVVVTGRSRTVLRSDLVLELSDGLS